MKILLYVLVVLPWLTCAQIAHGQLPQWEQQLKQTPQGTQRVLLLLKIVSATATHQPNKALNFANEGYQLAQRLKYLHGQSQLAHKLGTIYYYKGVYDEALLHYFTALDINEKAKDTLEQGKNLHNIALTYQHLKQYEQALHYYFQALSKIKQKGKKATLAKLYNDIGIVHKDLKKNTSALEYYTQSLGINQQLNDVDNQALNLNNIGQIYFEMGKYAQSIRYSQQALRLYRQINNQDEVINVLNNLGRAHIALDQLAQAQAYLEEVKKLLPRTTSQPLKVNYYSHWGNLLEKQGKYKKAVKVYHQLAQLKDSLFNTEHSKRLAKLQTRYNFEKRERENKALKQQKIQQQKTISHQRKRNNTLLFTTVFGILMAFVALLVAMKLFKAKEQQRRVNTALAHKNEQIKNQTDTLQEQKEAISQQKEELQSQTEILKMVNQRLKDLDNFKQETTHMIVHDLKTPLNYVIAMTNQEEVRQTGQQMLNMVLNILDVNKFEEAKMKLQRANWTLNGIIEAAIKQVSFLANQKSIRISSSLPQQVQVKVDQHLMIRVFANLLTNAIKYSPLSGTISIVQDQVLAKDKENPHMSIRVIDQGEGIPKNQLDRIFDKFAQANARDLENFRSSGLGLTFCKMAIEAHEGSIYANSRPKKGTTITVDLPIVRVSETPMATPDTHWTKNQAQKTDELKKLITKTDQELLLPVVAVLKTLDVYDYSEVKKALQGLAEVQTPALRMWKSSMQSTLLSCDEKNYKRLLKIVQD
jgi:signal transduction histidine kinase